MITENAQVMKFYSIVDGSHLQAWQVEGQNSSQIIVLYFPSQLHKH